MGRKKLEVKGIRVQVYLYPEQVKELDRKAKECGMSRSQYIVDKCKLQEFKK